MPIIKKENNRCETCHGLLYGVPKTTNDFWCQCPVLSSSVKLNPSYSDADNQDELWNEMFDDYDNWLKKNNCIFEGFIEELKSKYHISKK